MPLHVSSRLCPHRWCRATHQAIIFFTLCLALQVVVQSPWILLLPLIGMPVVLRLEKVRGQAHVEADEKRLADQQAKDIERRLERAAAEGEMSHEEALRRGSRGIGEIQVRPGWARVAVAMDMFALAVMAFFAIAALTLPNTTVGWEPDPVTTPLTWVCFWGLVYVMSFVHRQATTPAVDAGARWKAPQS